MSDPEYFTILDANESCTATKWINKRVCRNPQKVILPNGTTEQLEAIFKTALVKGINNEIKKKGSQMR